MTVDLDNADLETLTGLLTRTPAPLVPMDAVMIDGYLAGVSVQPTIVPAAEWLPGVFDIEGRALPEGMDAAWLARCRAFIERRFEVMNTDLAEAAWFDPVIVDVEQLPPPSEYETAQTDAGRALGPWLDGFHVALDRFPALRELDDSSVAARLTQIAALATMGDATHAVDTLVKSIAALWSTTEAQRYRVQTVRRAVPKVGRNDPCPCGSGRKYKACHGSTAAG